MNALATARRAARWVPLATLAIAAAVLGVALLGPRVFSDPYGVDPYSLRLAAAALLLLAASSTTRLRGARPVVLAVAAVALPFVTWSVTPRLLRGWLGENRLSGNAQFFWATAAQMVLTIAFLVAARQWLGPARQPGTRLGLPSRRAALIGAGASLGVLLIALAVPATLLGRLGLPPLALARDLPWLGPGDALQAAAQEVQFRGVLLGVLERSMPPWSANLAQALLFGLAHIAVNYEGPALAFVPVTIVLGLALGWMTQRTRSLWPAIAVHVTGEVAVTLAVIPGLYGY